MLLRKLHFLKIFVFAALLTSLAQPAKSFSVLAHEAIIDAEWEPVLKSIILKRYPTATPDQLIKAHSFAYGGSLVIDIGYLPGGNTYFTDLLHYVHSGQFYVNLINEADSLNEYAFALGALSHYIADEYGHSRATNVTVPMLYPDLRRKFGNVVTYGEDHLSHSRMEFAYDAIQVGRSNYASVAYHDFIGFNISVAPLERAFYKTYGQHLTDLYKNFDNSVSIMRWGVKNLFPQLTKKAWKTQKNEILKHNANATIRNFKYKMSRRMYNKEYPGHNNKPDFKARALAFLIKILPKAGPLAALKFVYPGVDGEKQFVRAFDTILVKYRDALRNVNNGKIMLADINLDTGKPITFGDYNLVDKTYQDLIFKLQKQHYAGLTPELRQHILSYFNGAIFYNLYKDHPEEEWKLHLALQQIKDYAVPANMASTTVSQIK